MANNFQVCHKSNILSSATVKSEDKIHGPSSFLDLAPTWTADGHDDDVAGGGDDEEKMRDVNQPGLVQVHWVALESLQKGTRKTRINRIILFFLTMTIS